MECRLNQSTTVCVCARVCMCLQGGFGRCVTASGYVMSNQGITSPRNLHFPLILCFDNFFAFVVDCKMNERLGQKN